MIILLRIVFMLTSIFFSGLYFIPVSLKAALIAALTSAVIALIILIIIEYISHTVTPRLLFVAVGGLMLGLSLGYLLNQAFSSLNIALLSGYYDIIQPLLYHIPGFALVFFSVINNEEIRILDRIFPRGGDDPDSGIAYKILDTSVIIDGRIADICDTHFIEGILVIPNFVLHELQMIADSADSIKRNRGRRGLDILNKMQKDQSIMVKISDIDFDDTNEVDTKLLKLAKVMKAKVLTNDFNLNKVAEFHGVQVLNINQLSNALKPIVLPGEFMRVALIKEGKDHNQAIGYLDDGTMVVVENGKNRLNDEVDVVVTSVLQTTAGRMIFSRIRDDR